MFVILNSAPICLVYVTSLSEGWSLEAAVMMPVHADGIGQSRECAINGDGKAAAIQACGLHW